MRGTFGPEAVEVRILSAGYGLVKEPQPIAPYDVTFNAMKKSEIAGWARCLNIPQAVRDAIRGWPLVGFLLGERYLSAIEPPMKPEEGQHLVFLAKPALVDSLSRSGAVVIGLSVGEATLFGAAQIALKGRVFECYARSLLRERESLFTRTCQDDTPATFMAAARRGLRY